MHPGDAVRRLPSRVYPVVDSADWVTRLVSAGARLVQLRIKLPGIGAGNASPAALRATVRASRDVCAAAGAVLVLNDHWRLAVEEGVEFLHLGQEDLKLADRPAIRRSGIRLGLSTHSDEELDCALRAEPDYIALGPIYPTTLKQMPWAPQGLPRLTAWRTRLEDAGLPGLPLVAIGGITLERAPGCLAAGADCVACVSDIVAAKDPEARLREWLGRLDSEHEGGANVL